VALTYTPPGELGSSLPSFKLKSVDGRTFSHESLMQNAKALVVMFICNHCPYVQAIEDRIIRLASEFGALGVSFAGICANDPTEYPEDKVEELFKRWQARAYGFPYLVDEDQSVARAFGAVCTPDIFVYDPSKRLVYRGRFDDSWRDERKVRRQELREALESLVNRRPVSPVQNPSMGCSIKWKTV
jgi:peroxiredoxin